MRLLLPALMLMTTIAGLAGAGFWWAAATMSPRILPPGSPKPPGKETDLLFELNDGSLIYSRIYDQGRYNTWAAISTAIAVLLQLAMTLLQ